MNWRGRRERNGNERKGREIVKSDERESIWERNRMTRTIREKGNGKNFC